MKAFVFYSLLLLLGFTAQAQFAIINDPDGFVNIRKEKSVNSKIVGKIVTSQIFEYDFLAEEKFSKKEWGPVNFISSGLTNYGSYKLKPQPNVEGFMFGNRITFLADLPQIPNSKIYRTLTKKGVTIKNDSIVLSITSKSFDVRNHKIHTDNSHCSNCGAGVVDKIDGKEPLGVDGVLPKLEIEHFTLIINSKSVEIPRTAFDDIYNFGLESMSVHFDKNGNIYLYMPQNSDGTGSYEVVWVINNGKLIKRYVEGSC